MGKLISGIFGGGTVKKVQPAKKVVGNLEVEAERAAAAETARLRRARGATTSFTGGAGILSTGATGKKELLGQ